MDTKKIEELILNRIKENEWKIDPDKDLRSLMEEVGELSREIRRIDTGRERPDETDVPESEIKKEIASEIGDILFPLVKIAAYYDITLEEAFMAHQNKMNARYEKKVGEVKKKEDYNQYSVTDLLEKAEKIATEAHKGQHDKGGNPYIEHPRRVAARMETIEEKIVAWLHDVVEDTDWTLEDLEREGFPPFIIQAVDAITKRKNESRQVYLYRVSQNDIARNVKKDGDIQENMDLRRIPNPTQKDFERVETYKHSYEILDGAGTTHFFGQTQYGYGWIKAVESYPPENEG